MTGLVRYICPCGFAVSARSAYAALLNLNDHMTVCPMTHPSTTNKGA